MSSRVVTGTVDRISILPPTCMRKVASETLLTETSSMESIASITRFEWSSPEVLTVKSRVILPPLVETTSIAAASPPQEPMADVINPNMPGRFGYSARMVMLYATPGVGPAISVSLINDNG